MTRFVWFLLALISASLAGAQAPRSISFDTAKLRFGDDLSWAAPDFDDGAWDEHDLRVSPERNGVFWFRVGFSVGEAADPLDHKVVELSMLASFEVYWDGELIGRSGVVGDSVASEVPGPIDNTFVVPRDLSRGEQHAIAVRASNFHFGLNLEYPFYGMLVRDHAESREVSFGYALPLVLLGGFLIIGIYYLSLFMLDERAVSSLLFSLLCFAVAALLTVEFWRWAVGYTWDRHLARLHAVAALTAVIAMLLPAFTLWRFDSRHKLPWLLTTAVLVSATALVPGGYDRWSALMFTASLGVSSALATLAVVRSQRGSVLVLVGFVAGMVATIMNPLWFPAVGFFLAFAVLVVLLLLSLTLQMRERRREREAARLMSLRLEAELLKRQIQPHFLMNTLTHVTEWIEREPARGVRLIEDLAEELRILGRCASEKLIPLRDEIALCRSHLAVMSCRRDVALELETDGVDESTEVPPALFHTLIENGITHNELNGAATFVLSESRSGRDRRYALLCPGRPRSDAATEGTGLRYVRARLEESFPDRWELESGPIDGGWRTEITLRGEG